MIPNPASDEVTISYNASGNQKTTLRMLNMTGAVISDMGIDIQLNGSVKINLQDKAAGIYIIELKSGDKTIVRKLVKE